MILLIPSGTGGPAANNCVLLVENDTNDALTACRELNQLDLCNPVCQVRTFAELIAYLMGNGEYADRKLHPFPAVIVLALRLPDSDGLQAQAWLRSNLHYKNIPLIAISSTERLNALKTAVTLGADGGMTKPFKKEEFLRLSQELRLPLEFERPLQTAELATGHAIPQGEMNKHAELRHCQAA